MLPPISLAHGWSIDVLTALRWKTVRRRAAMLPTAPVAVIAIDEETYETPPFKGSPTPTWTTEIGRVLTAVLDGGAKVAGFDIVFANSIEQSEFPFGDDFARREAARLRPPLPACRCATGAAAGKVVLGEVLRDDGAIGPSPGQRIAVRQRAEYPPAQHLFRSRRRGPTRAADLCRQGEAGPLDGAGAGRRARSRPSR